MLRAEDRVRAERGRREDKTGREKRGERSGGEERREAARIEQVCKEEIRVLQVSLQDWYIDLRESKTKRCGVSFSTANCVLNIISNAALLLYYKAIITNTCHKKKKKKKNKNMS